MIWLDAAKTFVVAYWKPLLALAVLVGVWGYGAHQYSKGQQDCRAEYEAEARKLKKESEDAIKIERDQADADKRILADYYDGLLSNGAKLQSGGIQARDPKGVCPASSQCVVVEEHLRFEERCAQDAAKLVRVWQWSERIGLKPE